MFDIGDRVRVIKEGNGHFGGNRFGQVGVVKDVEYYPRTLIVKFSERCHGDSSQFRWRLLDEEVELVETNGMYY